jgi:hypothetical protein
MDDTTPYPASLEIDYPDRPLNRLTTFFRVSLRFQLRSCWARFLAPNGLRPWAATPRHMVPELRVCCLCRCC